MPAVKVSGQDSPCREEAVPTTCESGAASIRRSTRRATDADMYVAGGNLPYCTAFLSTVTVSARTYGPAEVFLARKEETGSRPVTSSIESVSPPRKGV